jgi:hypothetical protein
VRVEWLGLAKWQCIGLVACGTFLEVSGGKRVILKESGGNSDVCRIFILYLFAGDTVPIYIIRQFGSLPVLF